MSKANEEPEGMEHLGILGRAMARARARSRAQGDEQPAETDAAQPPHGARKKRALGAPAAREFLGVVVGTDGVLSQGHFIPYSEIRDVRLVSSEHVGSSYGDIPEAPAVHWRVSLGLIGSDVLKLTRDLETGHGAAAVHYLADAIESCHEAWLAAQREPAPDPGPLARGEQTASDWLKALRRLGASTSPYRAPLVDMEHISRLLDDVRATPWIRAAAAVVLASSGDPTASERLRLSAASMANPWTRAALEKVAGATDEDAVAEALGTLFAGGGRGAHPIGFARRNGAA